MQVVQGKGTICSMGEHIGGLAQTMRDSEIVECFVDSSTNTKGLGSGCGNFICGFRGNSVSGGLRKSEQTLACVLFLHRPLGSSWEVAGKWLDRILN